MSWFLALDHEVQLAILGIISAVVAACIAVWRDSKKVPVKNRSVQIEGAIVDNSAIKSLASAVEAANITMREYLHSTRDVIAGGQLVAESNNHLADSVHVLADHTKDLAEQAQRVSTELQIGREVLASNRRHDQRN